jgi:FKBP-type peptidyl-prolyl cis-trans isomerase
MNVNKVTAWGIGLFTVAISIGLILYIASPLMFTKDNNTEMRQSLATSNSGSVLSVTQNSGLGAGVGSDTVDSDGSIKYEAAQTQINNEEFASYQSYVSEQTALFGDIRVGDGEVLEAGDTAVVTYVGRLTNGTIFDQSRTDSSNRTITPFEFEVGDNSVLTGFQQGIVGMKQGGVRRIIVPPAVGFGDQKTDTIPANSVLVFDVTLQKVKKN